MYNYDRVVYKEIQLIRHKYFYKIAMSKVNFFYPII